MSREQKINIRRAKPADLFLLSKWARLAASNDYSLYPIKVQAEIAARYRVKPLALGIWRHGRLVLIAEISGLPVGYLVAAPNVDGVGVLQWLYVHSSHRGNGVAAVLLESLETEAAEKGAHKLMVWTELAADFYTKAGWKLEATLPEHWWGQDFSVLGKKIRAVRV